MEGEQGFQHLKAISAEIDGVGPNQDIPGELPQAAAHGRGAESRIGVVRVGGRDYCMSLCC